MKVQEEGLNGIEELVNKPIKSNAELQIDQLAKFILKEIPGEPSRSEGAVDTAIRLMRGYRHQLKLLKSNPRVLRFTIQDLGLASDPGSRGYDAIVELDLPDPITGPMPNHGGDGKTWLFRSHGRTREGALGELRSNLSRHGVTGVTLPDVESQKETFVGCDHSIPERDRAAEMGCHICLESRLKLVREQLEDVRGERDAYMKSYQDVVRERNDLQRIVDQRGTR